MHQRANKYSPALDLGPFTGDSKSAIQSLYHVLNLDIRETAERIGAEHDAVAVDIWKMLLRDMFAAGAAGHDVMNAVRMISSEYEREV